MLGKIAAFEFRYQVKSPLFITVAALFFLAACADMAGLKLISIGGGNVLYNSPHSVIVYHLGVSLLFLFVGAAFVSNVIVRDDQTRFGPILRATRMTKADYLFGRFLGAFAVGALVMAAVPLGAWLGTMMPFANQEMLGPNRLSAFAYGYGLFALPNALIISALLFALATTTRSTAGTFIGVVGLLTLYFVAQGIMGGQPQLLGVRAFADPFGMATYMASSKYFTAAELNAGAVPVTELMVQSRLLWVGVSLACLALTYRLFRFSDRSVSRRQLRKLRRQAAMEASSSTAVTSSPYMRLAEPSFGGRTASAQFVARAAMEARYILQSPVFLILLIIAFLFALPGLLTAQGFLGGALYPLTSIAVPIIEESFDKLLIVVATYYGGELVWRERERKIHEIIDATPLPNWALMLPKMVGLALVLLTTLIVAMAVGILVQLIDGAVDIAVGEYLRWYLLPGAVDAILIAVLAVFVSALSPSKYAGWGMMVLYIILSFFAPSFGLEHPLLIYGSVPAVPLSDMAGTGYSGAAAWWFRLFWAASAALLLLAVHLLWPRGTKQRLKPRLRQLPARLSGRTGLVGLAALTLFVLNGSWIVYNTLIVNEFRTSSDTQSYYAEYEKRYFRHAGLPQPSIRHVALHVALYPEDARAEVRGRYRLVNETEAPIDRVHVRLMNLDLDLVSLDFPGARLELDDKQFSFRIYRLDQPMRPGESRAMAFRTRREQIGFRASNIEARLAPNGTDLNILELTPRIGMTDNGLIEDPATRRKYGLPEQQPFPRLGDLAGTRTPHNGDVSWTTADVTISTAAEQIAVAPGKQVSERVANGRRTARFVSNTPIKSYFAIQSGRYAVKSLTHGGVAHRIYYHPAHHWNVDRIMHAMRASLDYYGQAFGPYPYGQINIAERAGHYGGGSASPTTVAVYESIFALDQRNSADFDGVSMLTAHEVAHQWWGQQVLGARMQGAGMLVETLAQYSALMVMTRIQGDDGIRPFLQFQLDRYLTGRRTQVAEEQPLVSVGPGQDYIAYGKGPLAFYLLQQRIGEAAVNRALRRFVDKYRFTTAPYPRSLDLIAMLRAEATTSEQQALITDLFERITLYDLKATEPKAVRRADGKWDVSLIVEARKYYADGTGAEREARLAEPIEVGLWGMSRGPDAVRVERRPIRSGRQVIKLIADSKPTHVGIDPHGLYIDRVTADNVVAME